MTTETRFKDAIKGIRSIKIDNRVQFGVRVNVMSCCRGCAQIPDTKPYIWTFGGQDNAFGWFEGEAYDRSAIKKAKDYYRRPTKPLKDVYFYFTDISVAEVAKDAFTAQGFEVEWDGTEGQAVLVKLAA